ncbi:alpha/beta hydrolase [Nocardioides sp. AE5]|uniref:alpha/beta fold hydrolase n=1 Tax=Nocardioides sp. AE5 TaxID=2962573 RepID=UPI00288176C8|nr:alpha/beta hydrolase [Nocardioides sp. AE5]MDT0201442.1 alpha/beta hydrolase [Nocardioides sp. AE5]
MITSPRQLLRTAVHMPGAEVPVGAMVDLPGRGSTFVTDTPGPHPDSPAIVLLHALGTTGLLTWYPTIPALAGRFRVITLDQRWHGRGITSDEFSLADCADDAVALLDVLGIERALFGGFSMGSIVAQRVWRQHPGRVAGLVLGATTDRFRSTVSERVFHQAMELSMGTLRGLAQSRTASRALRSAGEALDLAPSDIHDFALAEFRSTSPWAVAQAVAALGRHHSRPWLGKIDVPVAVVVTLRDKVIEPQRQFDLARRIPGATIHEIDAGHASVVLEAEVFVPAFVEACSTVQARVGDFDA